MKKTPLFAIIGCIFGLPMSYYFQPDIIQSKLTLSQYIGKLPDVLGDSSGNYVMPVVMSCVIFALVFGVAGYLVDQARDKNDATKPPQHV